VIVRAPIAIGCLLLVAAPVLADPPPANPTPGPTPAPPAAPFRLTLGDLARPQAGQGHAEFDLGLRQEIWSDRMVRLAYTMSREQASLMRGGPVPPSAADMFIAMPGVGLGSVLAGPFASDWRDLTPEERFGRMTESVVYWSLAVAILSSIHRP
jgi:hypothetical protein